MKDSSGENHVEAADEPRYDQRLVRHFAATGGWRARKEIGELIEKARCSFSAATAYGDIRDWKNMLVEIEDGIREVEQLRQKLDDLPNDKLTNPDNERK